MNKDQIINQLKEKHQDFINHVLSLNESDYVFAPQNKWTAGQQLAHIIKSVVPITNALSMPLNILATTFGQANRPSIGYDELVATYLSKLAEGGTAPSAFLPKNQIFIDRTKLHQKLDEAVATLCEKVAGLSESDLDTYVLPHPLLGKLTLREMLYFTIYHVQHHQKLIEKYLKQ